MGSVADWVRWGGGSGWWGGQGGCEQRIEVFVKIQKKKLYGSGGGEGGGGWVGGVGFGGVRVDENEELKFWENSQKKNSGGGGR